MSKKYRLLKDLPDYKAGSVIEFCDETGYYRFIEECPDGVRGQWPPQYVDNNPTWFEPINERIEVISVRFCILPNENSVEINFDKKIKVSQFPLIKQAIEAIINNDNLTMDFTGSFDYLKEKKYTQEQLEAAFHSGRGRYVNHRNGETKYDYQTFQDYLKELQQKQP